jgi:acyl-CoA hydrolase
MSTLEALKQKSETRIFKAVFPNTTNHYDTLFGGTALHLMDEAAFICATRFSRKKMVTVSTEKIDFTTPIPQGTIVELVARVDRVGHSSCVVKVEIFMEDMYSYDRAKVVTGYFTFVAIGDDKKPVTILDN